MESSKRILLSSLVIILIIAVGIFSNIDFSASTDTELNVTATKSEYMYLYVKGQKQGDIVGSVVSKGHDGAIEVLSFSHDIITPRDPASGLPTGKRMHKPFIITKVIDKSSPLLYSALVSNENLPTWKLEFWRLSPTGTYQIYYTVQLVNANIAEISTKGSNFGSTESVAFTYQKIVWTWVDGGITAEDDWEAPTV